MSSPNDSRVSSTAASLDSVPSNPETREPWLSDQAELGSSNPPWYEEKSSNLRSSDIPFIKEKGGCLTTLRSFFLVPTRGLTVLLGAFTLSMLTSWRWVSGFLSRGPGKFYLSHKGDHAFIKGNLSSHKGWMSRFFFVKRVGKKRDPWKCDMFWRDNIYTFTPRTPDRSPNLDSFLDVMHEKSYNAPRLIQEDLLCFFGFSRRGVELVGDLHERMGKTERLQLMEEETAAGSSGVAAPSKKATKKRRASTPAEKEARREKRKKKKEEVPAPEARGAPTSETHREVPSIQEPEARPIDADHQYSLGLSREGGAVGASGSRTKARVAEDAERMRGEDANAWALVKEEFLQSSEFERLCTKKSVAYFKSGFEGAVAQFRANGYPEVEHPAPFLDAKKALRDMPEDEEEAAEEEDCNAQNH
ncbi:myosin heavy chain-related protein [Dorcoceras hygrometricum]|uniref:Myosin heavy chain-related protein n=1 Tax=Dorcoceras hygrometricum TaxID=472368 RepID=A0A2Z7CNZ6_9LAMI|nr:myosin heavy chain-related protein [Dorcoceras hygrometricum]